jgi:membrane-bound lytic murein transglycosylase B
MIPFARRDPRPAPVPPRLLPLLLAVALLLPAPPARAASAATPARSSYAARADVRAFIEQMADEHGFDRAALRRDFGRVHYQREIVAAMERPLLAPPKWYDYSRSFLAPERVAAGVAYWNGHAGELARAEERYGVPPGIVVAILGVETFYGRNTGKYRTLDALATLAFDYPRRAAFFRGELKQFLLLSRELGVSPLAPKGSFAGAMGVPQFMPGSYRSYAVDFDGSGRADLWQSPADIVGSVANYLGRHDWQRGQPVLLAARIADASRDDVLRRLDGGLSERRAAEAWAADGVTMTDAPGSLAPDPVGVLLLEEKTADGEGASYWIACHNFYVLTRYNRSRLYAAAVWELAKAIAAAR